MLFQSQNRLYHFLRIVLMPLISILFLAYFFLLLPIKSRALESSSGEYKVEFKDLEVTQPKENTSSVEPSPQILSQSVDRTLGIKLASFQPFSSVEPNKPTLAKINIDISAGKNQGYSLTLSQETPPQNQGLRTSPGPKNFPLFRGDSGDCQSLLYPCSWLVKSTYGLGYKPASVDPEQYQRLPILSDREPPTLILSQDYKSNSKISQVLKLNLPKRFAPDNWETTIINSLIPVF